jgi:hypothetical protein
MTANELIEQIEVIERLRAVIDELELLDADIDVPHTLALGLLEDIEAMEGTTT